MTNTSFNTSTLQTVTRSGSTRRWSAPPSAASCSYWTVYTSYTTLLHQPSPGKLGKGHLPVLEVAYSILYLPTYLPPQSVPGPAVEPAWRYAARRAGGTRADVRAPGPHQCGAVRERGSANTPVLQDYSKYGSSLDWIRYYLFRSSVEQWCAGHGMSFVYKSPYSWGGQGGVDELRVAGIVALPPTQTSRTRGAAPDTHKTGKHIIFKYVFLS